MNEEMPETPRISREEFKALMRMADELVAADQAFRIFAKVQAERASLRQRGVNPDVVARTR